MIPSALPPLIRLMKGPAGCWLSLLLATQAQAAPRAELLAGQRIATGCLIVEADGERRDDELTCAPCCASLRWAGSASAASMPR